LRFSPARLVSGAILGSRKENPIVNVRLFGGRKFVAAMLFIFMLGMVPEWHGLREES
jgi:hypothetical protein